MMEEHGEAQVRDLLLDRREQLQDAVALQSENVQFKKLLHEVDAALSRLNDKTYGLCRSCHEPIEAPRLLADPLIEYCVAHLPEHERNEYEQDLKLAAELQMALLPDRTFRFQGWELTYHYQGARGVSGDYCDILRGQDEAFYFLIGDVSGKGIGASLLMSHLHATFQALASMDLSLDTMVQRANRLFCESTLPTHFATLVLGRADHSGVIEICNAGHPYPFLIQHKTTSWVRSTGLPLGMFCGIEFNIERLYLVAGDALILYTDGLSEAENPAGVQYGTERLIDIAPILREVRTNDLLAVCLEDLSRFQQGMQPRDDLTVMALKRLAEND